jgi:CRISPR system Cascade subunit CasB
MGEETGHDIAKAAFGWWRGTLGNTGKGRAARAALRRCDSPVEVLLIPATHDLHAALGGQLQARGDTLALIAVALANLRETVPAPAAERFAKALSPIRFQSLLRAEDRAALIRPLRRALAQIDHEANVGRLAEDLFFWGEGVRSRWCFEYYGASQAAPEAEEESEA